MAGTGWAAFRLPRNSVGHAQLRKNAVTNINVKPHSLLARAFKPGQLPSGSRGGTGATGPRGPRGPRGHTGATGPVGPTAVAASALGDPPAGVGAFTAIASTTITTTAGGRLLVTGTSPTASVTCGGTACSQSYELFVDGNAIPKTTYTLSAGAGATKTSAVTIAGIVSGVTAGAHTVELRTASAGSPASFSADAAQVQALLAGG
jgi:hypothetical protein